jgi:serine/threonine-protein kinase
VTELSASGKRRIGFAEEEDAVSEETNSAPANVNPGDKISGYRLEEQIGQGGMAVVYRAHDERLDRRVALKLLAPGLASDTAFRTRFIRESRAAAAVDHPNIIPVYDAGDAGGFLFIAMRFVSGGDVRSLFSAGQVLSPARVWNIISQVASALDAAHAHDLIHRDVKPANILLDTSSRSTGAARGHSGEETEHVYLSDFGISKQTLASHLTSTGQFVGTLDYIAPETIEGRTIDGSVDQYSLACAAYEMLTGEPPYRRDLGLALINAHLSAPPPSVVAKRPELPAAVDLVLAKAMAKTSAERYPSCVEFATDLGKALGTVPGTPTVGGAAQQATALASGEQAPMHPATELASPVTAAGAAGAGAAGAGVAGAGAAGAGVAGAGVAGAGAGAAGAGLAGAGLAGAGLAGAGLAGAGGGQTPPPAAATNQQGVGQQGVGQQGVGQQGVGQQGVGQQGVGQQGVGQQGVGQQAAAASGQQAAAASGRQAGSANPNQPTPQWPADKPGGFDAATQYAPPRDSGPHGQGPTGQTPPPQQQPGNWQTGGQPNPGGYGQYPQPYQGYQQQPQAYQPQPYQTGPVGPPIQGYQGYQATGPGGPTGPTGPNWPQQPQQPAKRSRGILIGAVLTTLVVAIAAVVVVYLVIVPHHKTNSAGGGGGHSKSSAPVTPSGSTSSSSSPDTSPATSSSAASEATAVNNLLSTSATSRTAWDANTLVTNVGNCVNIGSDVSQISDIANERKSELSQASDLQTSAIPNGGTLKSELMTALQISLNIDNDYLAWAQQQQSSGCSVGTDSSYYDEASSLDSQATADKQTFVDTWNPIATEYNLEQFQAGQI